jgi:tetratricopeptide (TPR) repeat protein
MRAHAYLLAFALLAALPCALEAQSVADFGGPLEEADLLYFAGRPEEAHEILQRYLAQHPDDYEALWRATRARVVLGVQETGGRAQQNVWLDRAITWGDRAVALRPDGIDGIYWRGAAVGRRAMNASPGYAADLAQRVYDDAHTILAMDPTHGGAHNLLGKLNYEIMSLSRIERFFGRHLVRKQALRDSSWEDAEEHLAAAARSWPDLVLFQFDLAQLYRKRGREDEARVALERVTEMAPTHPLDPSFQADARRYLAELGS